MMLQTVKLQCYCTPECQPAKYFAVSRNFSRGFRICTFIRLIRISVAKYPP